MGPWFRFDWQHPWALLLIIPLLAGWWWSRRSYYVRKVHAYLVPLVNEANGTGRRMRRAIRFGSPVFFRLLAMLLLIMALVDVTRTYEQVEDTTETHRVFIIWDSSSSTYGFNQSRFPAITCATTGKFFPRIHGICRAAYRVIDEVEHVARAKGGRSQDLLALVQFASYSYVISYPTSDYAGFRKRVDDMDLYLSKILGISTDMHLAIWDAYMMALERNTDQKSGFTYLNGQDIRRLALALAPGESASSLSLPNDLREKLERIRQEMHDTVFIVLTDAVVSFLTSRVEAGSPYSIRRQMQLAEFLETPFFYFSTDEFYPELKRLARRTGSGAPDSPNRGDFFMVKKDRDYAQMSELVGEVLKARFSQKVTTHVLRRESYAELCVGAALCFFLMSIWWNKSFARSLTDTE